MNIKIWTDDQLINAVKKSKSYATVLRLIGLKVAGSNYDTIKRRIKELNCSIEHFGSKNVQSANAKYTLNEILVENSSYANISRLKTRLINEGRLEYKCAMCGNEGKWQGKDLTLQLDHINGINNDHRLENLRFLCPNCHSITPTYAGKNKNLGD